jgi:hypothetical protein
MRSNRSRRAFVLHSLFTIRSLPFALYHSLFTIRSGPQKAYRMLFIESKELRKIESILGAAKVHIPVTNPVVIKTTRTQPGTSPRSSCRALVALKRKR